jgi:galactofuranose transport system substrate-binding protein
MAILANSMCVLGTLVLVNATTVVRAAETSNAVRAVLDFDKSGAKLEKPYKVAYLIQCVSNPYCQANIQGMEAASKKFGFTFKIFDGNYTSAEQLRQTQDATAENFDGYVFAPVTAASGCSLWKQYLSPTGKPVVTVDLPMCGDRDYTVGVDATVLLQGIDYADAMAEYAFASCGSKACALAALGGFVGSDLQNLWEAAIKKAAASHPNVHVIVNQAANYDPQVAMRVTQDALKAHPEIDLILSAWDDMSRGILQAVNYAGKKPGEVKIFSSGGMKDAIDKIKQGEYESTAVLVPREEGYFAGVAMAMALQGKSVKAFIDEKQLPTIAEGPGTIFVTKPNVDKFTPEY